MTPQIASLHHTLTGLKVHIPRYFVVQQQKGAPGTATQDAAMEWTMVEAFHHASDAEMTAGALQAEAAPGIRYGVVDTDTVALISVSAE